MNQGSVRHMNSPHQSSNHHMNHHHANMDHHHHHPAGAHGPTNGGNSHHMGSPMHPGGHHHLGGQPGGQHQPPPPNVVATMPTKSKKPHIKKPLNAFMLFMKEQRAQVVSECTLRESAAINQILGRKWHELERAEQSKYYEMARQERLKHMQLYPGWSARDNYGLKKKRRRKREKVIGENGELPRKCRARFGLSRVDLWCKPCKYVLLFFSFLFYMFCRVYFAILSQNFISKYFYRNRKINLIA